MLIITEKPSVAKDFASALGCSFRSGYYSDGKTDITNCVGHLYRLQNPEFYDAKFKSWSEIPIIPEKFCYAENENTEKQTKLVASLLNRHRNDSILIATDADREGEIIARECLMQCGITDFSKIKRFWVSQALTPEVIKAGIGSALPLSQYNSLAENGFGRQHSDWLCGYNFTRYISNAGNRKLSVGRVQTAILSAIEERCSQIENFKSEKYFEHYANFEPTAPTQRCTVRGIYFEDENKTSFSDNSREAELKKDIGSNAMLLEFNHEKKEIPAPQLYNLNAVQKDAFKAYGYSADKTLNIIQKLYEEYKCVSYPRTPSRVMGSKNVELCRKIFNDLSEVYTDMKKALEASDISLSNKRCFNDAQLEAHHALIPLKVLPNSATQEEINVYGLIWERFKVAFASPYIYDKQTIILSVNSHKYKICGKQIIDLGWKALVQEKQLVFDPHGEGASSGMEWTPNPTYEDSLEQDLDGQDLNGMDFNLLMLSGIETKEKWTKPPKHFNEASILAFMENPKSENENAGKLVGLGTSATRHTFIPILKERGYIEVQKKNIVVTALGKALLKAVRGSPIKSIADVSETTNWEKRLEENPADFERKIKEFVRDSVSEKIEVELPQAESQTICPKCGKPVRKGSKNWYCTGYKDGCGFKLWETVAGAKLTEKDVSALCSGKKTSVKKLTSKGGKDFKAKLYLDECFEVKFRFD